MATRHYVLYCRHCRRWGAAYTTTSKEPTLSCQYCGQKNRAKDTKVLGPMNAKEASSTVAIRNGKAGGLSDDDIFYTKYSLSKGKKH